MSFRILYQDDFMIAIEKPPGFHVHPPEDSNHPISNHFNCLHLLRNQISQYLYPVHRLDRATSGVLLFGLKSDSARKLCQAFENHQIRKTYFCVTRGWTDEAGQIDAPLGTSGALTSYSRLGKLELPHSVSRYPSARYSLLQVEPRSGRQHQIRRHFAHISHPLIGDTVYGSGEHNRYFRSQLLIHGLLLKAYSVELLHPETGEPLQITSRWNGLWHRVFDRFEVCPQPIKI